MRTIQYILLPLSHCYGLLMKIRNKLFDTGLLKAKSFDIALISVGNLSYGGTGKTPVIEYLIRLLKDHFLTATLSRGYGRNSTGFVLASRKSSYRYIGDEPLQFAKKFSDVKVAVDAKRERGIASLMQKFSQLGVILLDDAFQHRYVKPGLSVLLTDYHKPYYEDHVLPSGTLREFPSGAKRADLIIVTKTPKVFSPITRRRIIEDLKPRAHQTVLFSYLKYGEPVSVCGEPNDLSQSRYSYILLFTGIANDYPLREFLERKCTQLIRLKFSDHHPYNEADITRIKSVFTDIPSQKKAIFTTEKDMMRLKTPELLPLIKALPLFYLPVEVDFHGEDGATFNRIVMDYVRKSSGIR